MGFIHAMIVFLTEAYLKFYGVVSLIAFIWKGAFLTYHSGIFWMEIILLVIVIILQLICITLSRIEEETAAAGLIIPALLRVLHFILWQQYVLRLEVIINSILITFQILYALTCFVK